MAIPNLGAYIKSWRALFDLRKLQGEKAGLLRASHFVFGPRYSRNNNEMFGVLPLRKSGTSSKKKKMKKRKEKKGKMKKKRKRRKKRQRKKRKQKKKTKKKKTKKKKRKRKKTGKKLREKRRNERRTGGGTDCEREPATQEGIFFFLISQSQKAEVDSRAISTR